MVDVSARRPRRAHAHVLMAVISLLLASGASAGQSTAERLAALRAQGQQEGWTFTVGQTSASDRTFEELCGLVEPEDWWVDAPFDPCSPRLGLPVAFDWRTQSGCPPVRDQGSCGSCWAFATVGPLECNILIQDGTSVDLAEQWLLSCNRSGYDCGGGWYAHEYHASTPDSCGGAGAVLEEDFPYVAADVACGCPYDHPYTIDGWAYVGSSQGVPSTAAMKQAIMDYGPISVGVCVNQAFCDYTGGVFNACAWGRVNHAVTLVGWNDNQGSAGVWILRNSWGSDWGTDGYMLIEYGCSSVGYAACYVQYAGASSPRITVTPAQLDFGEVEVGSQATRVFTVKNVGGDTLTGSATDLGTPFALVGITEYTLAPSQTQDITVRFTPTLQGSFSAAADFSGGGGATAGVSGTGTGSGPSNTCADAPYIGDGTFTGSNVGADTETSASCGGGGTADVWWCYSALQSGTLTIDTCGSDFDTVLSVYNACNGTELVCNDDYPNCAGNAYASRVSLPVTTGEQYHIRVAGSSATSGDIVLHTATTAATPIISGRVTTSGGTPVAGVTITGLPGSPVTDDDGDYATTVTYGFAGTATPQKTAYTFSPSSIHYSGVITDRPNQHYTAIPPSFTIAGTVTDEDGNRLAGASLTGLPGNPVTDASGYYQATVTLGFTGIATPDKLGCTFVPTSRSYDDVGTDLLTEDYDGRQWTGALCVTLAPDAAVQAGAAWQVDGGAWQESGRTVTKLPVGRHSVSYATPAGWTALPSEQASIEHDQTLRLERTFTQKRYTLTLIGASPAIGEVVAAPAPDQSGRYVQDTVVTLTAVPVPGFRVQSWSGADDSPALGRENNTVTMSSNRTVIIVFNLDPFCVYQLSATVTGDGGTIEPRRGVYREDALVELLATPDDGYQVKAWSGTDDDSSASTTNAVTMDGHKSVRVEFEPWSDCNADGLSDRLNIALADSLDCNVNGIPDECELDSDGDGIIDDCDLAGAEDDLHQVDGLNLSASGAGLCGVGFVETLAFTLVGLWFLKRGRH